MNMKWKSAFALLIATVLVASTALAAEPEKKPAQVPVPAVPKFTKATLPPYLQEISVTIRTDRAEGSGTLVVRGQDSYVFTAGHVVDDLREVREVIDPVKGSKKIVIEFRNAKVINILREDGEAVGRVEMDATVLSYSDSENGEDLALLRLKKKNYATKGAFFYRQSKEEKYPQVGAELYHCGSLLGEFGSNSLINGIVSQVGRVYQKKLYDQTNLAVFPGSSGGGVYVKDDGRYCGMIVRGAVGGFNLMVPMRRIDSWAQRMKLEWVFDASLPVPSEAELQKISIEDTGFPVSAATADKKTGGSHHSVATKDRFGFLIRPLGSDGAALMEGSLAPQDPLILRVIRELKK